MSVHDVEVLVPGDLHDLVRQRQNVLRLAGVKTYLHVIDKGRETHVGMMERLGFQRWGTTDDGDTIMKRDLT